MPPPNQFFCVQINLVLKCIAGALGFLGCKTTETPDDQKLDSHFKMFNRPDILELINNEGDIEHPVTLGLTLLRKVPEFRKLAVKAGFRILFA